MKNFFERKIVTVLIIIVLAMCVLLTFKVIAIVPPEPFPRGSGITSVGDSESQFGYGFGLAFTEQIERASESASAYFNRITESGSTVDAIILFDSTRYYHLPSNKYLVYVNSQAAPMEYSLVAGSDYFVTVGASYFRDSQNSSDYWAGITNETDWTFRTAEFPDITYTPTPGSTVVGTTTDITMEFASPVQLGITGGLLEIYHVSGGLTVASYEYTDPEHVILSEDGYTLTINTDYEFEDGVYRITYNERLLSDAQTLLLIPPLSSPTGWTFTMDTTPAPPPEEEEEEPAPEEDTNTGAGDRKPGRRSPVGGGTTSGQTDAPAPAPALPSTLCPYFETNLSTSDFGPAVTKVVDFLNQYEGETIPVTDTYNGLVVEAVKRFQAKYATQILSPIGLTAPTGNWYIMTKAMANKLLGC